jgi:asparagine synthase (glutamine-hydrolysing)
MCGIAGSIDFENPADAGLLRVFCDDMRHRGPDSRGLMAEDGVGLAMQRLAIIGVADGDQPIHNEDRSVSVVLNGEIYNFRELREELIARGHVFTTHADTEVLVHLYEEHGEDFVTHLRGMFAFALYDRRERRLLLGRDRVGKKPLFYAHIGRRLVFASEIRTLLRDPAVPRDIDAAAIRAYLGLQYVPHPMSALRAVRKLEPGHTLDVRESGVRARRYWRLSHRPPAVPRDEREIREELLSLLREAVRVRLVSEVPLGAFLSGGIDSSAVVAFMAEQMAEPVKTFSIGFSEAAFDEVRYARMVAERFGTDHEEFRVEPEGLSIMPRLARHYGEPYGDPSAIPSFHLAEMTARHVTVALNGDGGDESFAGYGRYVHNSVAGRFDRLPGGLRRAAARAGRAAGGRPARFGELLELGPAERYARSMCIWPRDMLEPLLAPEFAAEAGATGAEELLVGLWHDSDAPDDLGRMLATDVESYLPGDLLVKMDIATMAHSLEARSPFLDHHVMEFAASLPAEVKLRGTDGKKILKGALRGLLPDDVLDRPKMGFGVPLARWFRHELRDLPAERLLDPSAGARGYFRPAEMERVIAEHHSGAADHAHRIWVLLMLDAWHREVLDVPAGPRQAPVASDV